MVDGSFEIRKRRMVLVEADWRSWHGSSKTRKLAVVYGRQQGWTGKLLDDDPFGRWQKGMVPVEADWGIGDARK